MTSTHAFRLLPGTDLRQGIQSFVEEKGITAGWVSCCVGSLSTSHIRYANQPEGQKQTGPFEIVSLNGTLSIHGSHLHISISNEAGSMIGGHLLTGNEVYTTAEIIIQEAVHLVFTRGADGSTPWKELQISPKDL
ncbi:MAG: PPC domain-containing DNA-binding protein [Chitinophagaceae bacterium]